MSFAVRVGVSRRVPRLLREESLPTGPLGVKFPDTLPFARQKHEPAGASNPQMSSNRFAGDAPHSADQPPPGIANLIVWPAILDRFRRAALGATLLRCTGKLQREESVIHVVADRLEDITPRLNTLRDRTGDGEPRPKPKPPFAPPTK